MRSKLTLADNRGSPPIDTPWADSYLALGARLARLVGTLERRQLIVVLSVPRRDYVACLIGTGWTLTRPARSDAADALELFKMLDRGTWCRAVTDTHVYLGALGDIEENRRPPRVHFAETTLHVDALKRAVRVADLGGGNSQPRPQPGSLARYSGADKDWQERLVAPAQDLAIIGIESRLRSDMDAVITRRGDNDGENLHTLLLPWDTNAATWFSKVYSSSRLEGIPEEFNAVILDGQGAMKFISETFAPIVVCIIDRSLADETQAENLLNMRLTEGTSISAANGIGWKPPTGVEAMAFEARL